MIKCETLGMYDVAKINPVLTSSNAVHNYDFVVNDDITYLVDNVIVGDDSYTDAVELKAGEYLNGYNVEAWKGQNIIVDEKHIAYGSGVTYANITVGTTLFKVNASGKLEIINAVPASGIYFKAVDKRKLTEKAVVLKVFVVDSNSGVTTLSGLSDVDLTTPPANGQVLGYNGTKWTAANDQTE